MTRDGLTFTMVFLAESANYGEGIGNITTLKKMTRGDFQQYSYISRQAMRYNIVKQLKWDNTPVDGKSGVVQFAPSATIEDYPEIDLFGYMKTTSKADDKKGGASTRSAVVRLSNAISLEPYQSDLEFLTNMGLAQRQNLENGIAQSEIHRSYYSYTISIDLDRIGVDVEIEVSQEEKASRGIESLPADLHAAICELQKDAFIKEVLGEHISSKLIEAKEVEWMQYRTQVTGWELSLIHISEPTRP